MFPSLLIGLREGLEAALIVGLVLGVLQKMDKNEYKPIIWYGVAAATLISVLSALAIQLVGARLEGRAEEIFEGLTMFLAAAVLTWMIFWMQRMSRQMQKGLENEVRTAVQQSQTLGLFGIAFFAVLREGIETALFLSAAAMTASTRESLIGGLIGIFIAILLGWALFASTIRLDIRRFFQVTSVLLILFAAGLLTHGVHEFYEAGLIPGLISPVWDTNTFLNEDSILGKLLKSLFGYNADPSLTEVIAYLGYFIVITIGIRSLSKKTAVMVEAGK